LMVSAIFPSKPVQSPGRRTEKSPSRTAWSTLSNSESWVCGGDERTAVEIGGTTDSVRCMRVLQEETQNGYSITGDRVSKQESRSAVR
jgi:hypothetical protein